MTRTLIDTNILKQQALTGVAVDVKTAFQDTAIAIINEHAAALDLAVVPVGGAMVETLTSGAATTTVALSLLSITNTVAFSLADGTVVGQKKSFEVSAISGTPLGTLTINDAFGSELAVYTFTALGQRLDLEWRTTGWKVIGKRRAGRQAVVVGTTVLTNLVMAAVYDLSVTGTVSSTTTKGIPDGNFPGERIHVCTPTAATSPVGDIAITAHTVATGVAATSLAGINATTAEATFEWTGASWQNIKLTTATLA
jgi:hypothetical protein